MADESWRYEDDLLLVEAYGQVAVPPSAPRWNASELGSVRLRGVIYVPGDEVIFYLVTAPSVAELERVLAASEVASVRIVAAAWARPTCRRGRARLGTGRR